MNLDEVRALFPHTAENITYFNHASNSPIHNRIKERLFEYLEERNHKMIVNFDKSLVASKNAKIKLSEMLGCTPDRISWAENVSSGTSSIVQGIKWNTGDRIILNDLEFPSNVYPFLNLKSEGVEIDFVKSRKGKVSVEDYEKLITPKTKLISVSLVQFLSGFRIDVKRLGEICKERGILFVVDGIQGAGVVNINIKESNIDLFTGGSHKWLMSLQGTGYFYISKKLQDMVHQRNVGWTSVAAPWDLLDYDLTLREDADRFQNGTLNFIGITALDESLNLYKEFGMENVERNVLSNTEYFINKLSEGGIKTLLENVSLNDLSGIVTIEPENPKRLFINLEKKKIFCSLREGKIRFSPHFYNTKEEIDFVIEELVKK
jgi:selenocysteine lyase/cysteine desulfurase